MTPLNLRPALARHLRQRCRAFRDGFRHNLALIGPPGSGKTFQLHQVITQPPAGTTVLYCPLYRESCRTFLQRLRSVIVRAGLEAGPGPSEELLLRQAQRTLPKTAAALRSIEPTLSRRAYSEALIRTLDTIPVLSKERGQPCLFILDEFLFLEDLGLAHPFHELGKRVMTWPSVLFILSSSSPYRARTILRERLQLLFGQFELLTLEALEPRRVGAWVHQELRGLRRIRAVSPFLIWWLGSSPSYLTVILKRLRELATLQRVPEVTEALFLQSLWDVLGSPEGPLHQWCASRTEPLTRIRGTRAMEALLQIADGARTTTEIGRRIGRAGLPAALQVLIEQDLAQRNGTCWVTPDPVLRCWLSTVLWAQHGPSPLDAGAVRRRLEQYLQSLWSHWMQWQQRSLPERVTDLLAQFADETVSLDRKTGRLPRFHRIESQPRAPGRDVYLIAEGDGRQWCCSVAEEPVTEQRVAAFETFCRAHHPKPARKVLIAMAGLEENATLLAKAANMWVWGAGELETLTGLYRSPHVNGDP